MQVLVSVRRSEEAAKRFEREGTAIAGFTDIQKEQIFISTVTDADRWFNDSLGKCWTRFLDPGDSFWCIYETYRTISFSEVGVFLSSHMQMKHLVTLQRRG